MPVFPLTRLLLVVLVLTLVAIEPAQAQDCGNAHREPQRGRIGTAPLAIGDSVMLGAARVLSRKGFEVDARCARGPSEGLSILRQRRRRGTLPEIVVMALGTNIVMSRGDIRAHDSRRRPAAHPDARNALPRVAPVSHARRCGG